MYQLRKLIVSQLILLSMIGCSSTETAPQQEREDFPEPKRKPTPRKPPKPTQPPVNPQKELEERINKKYPNGLNKPMGTNGQYPIHQACIDGDLQEIDYLIEKHPKLVNKADKNKNTPLHILSRKGNEEGIKKLLSLSNIETGLRNDENLRPLQEAAKHGHDKALKTFLASDKTNAGHYVTLLTTAVEHYQPKVVETIINDPTNGTQAALRLATRAITHSKIELANQLLNSKKISSEEWNKVLHQKCKENKLDFFSHLVSNTNITNTELQQLQNDLKKLNKDPLGKEDIIPIVFKKEAKEEKIKYLSSIIEYPKNNPLLETLITDPNLDVNSPLDKHNATLPMVAALSGNLEGLKILLKRNETNIDIPDNDGFTAISFALWRVDRKFILELLKSGKTIDLSRQFNYDEADATLEDTTADGLSVEWPEKGPKKYLTLVEGIDMMIDLLDKKGALSQNDQKLRTTFTDIRQDLIDAGATG